MKLKWISDAGHAWLEVDRDELSRLGIDKEVSSYSYQKGSKVYLEEDCDAPMFFRAFFKNEKWYEVEELRKERNRIPTEIWDRYAPLRKYKSYQSI